MLLDIIQDYCKCYDFCVIHSVSNAFLPFVLGFDAEILEQQSRLFICDNFCWFILHAARLKYIYLPAELELLLFCFTRSRIIV